MEGKGRGRFCRMGFGEFLLSLLLMCGCLGSKLICENSRLNVNFPKVDSRCRSPSDFKFVLSRIYPKVPFVGEDDVETCGSRRLPIERKVVGAPGCYASISVGEENKTTAPRRAQTFVLNRLRPILSCLP